MVPAMDVAGQQREDAGGSGDATGMEKARFPAVASHHGRAGAEDTKGAEMPAKDVADMSVKELVLKQVQLPANQKCKSAAILQVEKGYGALRGHADEAEKPASEDDTGLEKSRLPAGLLEAVAEAILVMNMVEEFKKQEEP